MASPLRILIVSVEMAPFAKVGGLADVAGALPKALVRLGHDVRCVMPAYPMVERDPRWGAQDALAAFPVPIRDHCSDWAYVKRVDLPDRGAEQGNRGTGEQANGRTGDLNTPTPEHQNTRTPTIPVYLVGNAAAPGADWHSASYFSGATESRRLYDYHPEPYIFFCRAVLAMLDRLQPEWQPDVIHCNDWHTGLLPVYIRRRHAAGRPATLFTIHNLAYQGDFDPYLFPLTGLPWDMLNVNGLEFYGRWTFMKGALTSADRVNTVSPRYAAEIQTPEYGNGLDGLLRTLAAEGKLSGILNGIDTDEFDPATDERIPANFSADAPAGKKQCKRALQAELGLHVSDAPLIGIVSRLADQKGFDLIQAAMDQILAMPVQLVLLGTGDPSYEHLFTRLATAHPERIHARIGFDIALAQRIYAGSDMFLMPSHFEPCGLGQLISLRYGSIPIVRATGGLADTIVNYDPTATPDGNGFSFNDRTPWAMTNAIQRALAAYQDSAVWSALVHRAMTADFSWRQSAQRYVELYRTAMRVDS